MCVALTFSESFVTQRVKLRAQVSEIFSITHLEYFLNAVNLKKSKIVLKLI